MKTYKEDVRKRFLHEMRLIIAERRNKINSITAFANAVGEYQQNISKMEQGERYPTIDLLCRMCETFNVSPGKLLLGVDEAAGFERRLAKLESEIKTVKRKI